LEVYIKKKRKIDNNEGIGLVEALIAIALAIILVVSLLTLTNFNIRNSLLVTENQDAITSANLLLENLRSLKDSDFTFFAGRVFSACKTSNCTVNSSGEIDNNVDLDVSSPVSYFRVEEISPQEIKINIITQWKVGSSTFSSPLSTTFTNWRSN
jgi:Tfp pilus assembly protein PilV